MTAPPGARLLEYMRFRLLWPAEPFRGDGYDFQKAFAHLFIRVIVNGECVRKVRLLELPDIPVQQDNGRGTQLFGLALDYPVCPGDEISARVDLPLSRYLNLSYHEEFNTDEPASPWTEGFTLQAECSITGELAIERGTA